MLVPAVLGIPNIVVIIALILLVIVLWKSVVIVDAYNRKALTVLGEFRKVLGPGINLVPPFVNKTYTFDMRTQTIDVPRQEAITRDNSPVTCDAVVYMKVNDAEKAFLEVDDHKSAVSNLAQTTLRSVLGDMELDDTLNKRTEINTRIRNDLDEATDAWGISVESVEVREVQPSADVKDAMEKQTSAERKRRAMILEAQGKRRSAVEEAQGKKQSEIIEAQGKKQSQVLKAQGDAISTVLRAKSAEAMGERAVIEKGLETLSDVGKGDSNTIVLPQELTSLVSRYGDQLTGGDVSGVEGTLDSLEFDEETKELLGIDDIEKLVSDLDEEADVNVEEISGEEEVKEASVEEIEDPEEIVGDIEGGNTDGNNNDENN